MVLFLLGIVHWLSNFYFYKLYLLLFLMAISTNHTTNPKGYFLEQGIYNVYLILKQKIEDLEYTKPTEQTREDIEQIQEILNEILAR